MKNFLHGLIIRMLFQNLGFEEYQSALIRQFIHLLIRLAIQQCHGKLKFRWGEFIAIKSPCMSLTLDFSRRVEVFFIPVWKQLFWLKKATR